MSAPGETVLEARDVRVELTGGLPIVEQLDLAVRAGELVGLIGESGSGKTTAALALLGYANAGTRLAAGSVSIVGEQITGRDARTQRSMRGRLISYVPQDPATALNPSLRVRDQLGELLRAHRIPGDHDELILDVLGRVELPAERSFARRFPHQLSGGQQQRVALAMAIVCRPAVAVLDEPTTGLDVVTQARILAEVDHLRRDEGMGMVYVSHDLAVVAGIADRVAVMYAGAVVEEGPADELLKAPKHPYTVGLISSVPDHVEPRRLRGIGGVAAGVQDRPPGCRFAPRCAQRVDACEEALPDLVAVSAAHLSRCREWRRTPRIAIEPASHELVSERANALLAVEDLCASYRGKRESVVAARDVNLLVAPGECLALVGESGSGKTTIARCIVGLHRPDAGRIVLDGEPLAALAKQRAKEQRRRMQIVFQNPYDSLNPRHSVGETIAAPARFFGDLSKADAQAQAGELLERVRLPARLARRYPQEISGGERQRVAIARALAARPDFIVCDEVTSALDVSVQAAVLDLLGQLRRELGLALLFVSHNLGVVASVCDRVVVLERGRVRESGSTDHVLGAPADAYTRRLLEAAPRLALDQGPSSQPPSTTWTVPVTNEDSSEAR